MALLPVAGHGQNLPFACAGSRAAYGVSGYANSVFAWEIEGGKIVLNENDTIVVEWNFDRGVHRLQVVEITGYDCIGAPVEAYVNVQGPEVNLGEEYEICKGDSLLLDVETNYTPQMEYFWNDGNSGSTHYVKDQGIVWVQALGSDGCSDYDSAVLIVNPLPLVDLGRDTLLCGTSTLEIDAGFFAMYEWSTNEIINPITVGSADGFADTISVMVTDNNGCSSSDTIVIFQCAVDRFFANIPNTILPDRVTSPNKTWRIDHIDLFPGAVVEIFDRWGRLIYHAEDPDPYNVWDGKSQAGNEMPMDSYYYVIDLKYRNAEPLVGTINVVR
jgi:gliding motility-associated-like protein